MPKANSDWKVLQHGPLTHLSENLWWVQGSLPRMSLKRVMTIVRLNDGGLLIHNAIALDDPAMRELEAWGRPAFRPTSGATQSYASSLPVGLARP
jgi:hypothetical protein